MRKLLTLLFVGVMLISVAQVASAVSQTTSTSKEAATSSSVHSVPLFKHNGIYVVAVLINNAVTMDFVVDSGASDVSISEDVLATLMQKGTIRKTDYLGNKVYQQADGSKMPSKVYLIKSLKVGDRVIENVIVRVGSARGSLLLGQSFLGQFKSWTIDNTTQSLLLQ
jgi:clan AA aspartic protease (TIGR02281 family)